MKKLFLVLAVLVGAMNVSAKIVDNASFVNIGYSYNHKAVNNPNQICFNFSLCGFFAEVSKGLNGKSENTYGSGGVSDDYRYTNIQGGYLFTLYRGGIYEKPRLFAGPTVGVNIEEQLYNDKYYDSDVASSKCKFDYGIAIGVRLWKHCSLVATATMNKVGVSLGIAF